VGTLFVDRKFTTIILVDDTILFTAPSSTPATPTVAPTTNTENND
jgi:hypothetical protein